MNKTSDLSKVLLISIGSMFFVFAILSFRSPDAQMALDKDKKIVTLTTENFDEFVKGKLVLVDFWASWCYPCRLQNPILEEVNQEIGNKVSIGKVNVDENRSLSTTYGITSIPTLLFFKKGTVVERLVGLQQKDVLLTKLKSHMD